MFGVTFHDVLTGMAGNAGWAFMLAALTGFTYIYKRFREPGLARVLVRGGISTIQLLISALYFVAAAVIHDGRGFPAGEEFVSFLLCGVMYLGFYAGSNRNWLVPAIEKALELWGHITDLARPEYAKPDSVKIEDLIAALNVKPLSAESNIAILRLASRGTDATDALVAALDSPSEKIRANAAGVLAKIKDARAIPALKTRLDMETDFLASRALEVALGMIGKPAIPELVSVLENGTPKAREAAVSALGFMREEEACEALVKYLSDWRSRKSTEARILFDFGGQIAHTYEKFQHHEFQNLPPEEKAAERKKIWDEENQWRRDTEEYLDFGNWYVPVNVGNALKHIATRPFKSKIDVRT